MKKQPTTTRRRFLKGAAATTVGAMSLPSIIPASALGKDGAVAPSNRLVMGCVGTGGKGTHNMQTFLRNADVQVVAVCDVDTNHRNRASNIVNQKNGNKDCAAYKDFRELVARKDIDLVSVATPDHWHALASVAAMKNGKDVYCEKPLANSVGESMAIRDTAAKTKRVLQCGSHERSTGSIRFACELVRNGRIGKLHTMRVNLPCSDGHHRQARSLKGKPAKETIPEGFDYDMWLGHTPKADYTARRCHFWWRFILAYGGGEMTDRGAHVIDIAQLGAGMDDSGPVEYEAKGVASKTGLYDAWWDYSFTNTYANGLKMIGTTDNPRGVKFEGADGWIFVHIHGGRLEFSDKSLAKEKPATGDKSLGRSPGHHRNFLDCAKSRKDPFATAEIGHRTATLCHLNNLAMTLGRKIRWEPKKEQVIGDAQANRLLTPKMRKPWSL